MELAASSRICSRVKCELALDEDVLVEQVGAEHGWVVGVEREHEAAFEVLADGVLFEAGQQPVRRLEVRLSSMGIWRSARMRRRSASCCAARPWPMRSAPMLRADQMEAGPWTGPVDSPAWASEAEAGGFGFGVELAEGFGGAAGFVAADADADDAGIGVAEVGGEAEDGGGFIEAEVADGVDDPEDGGAGFGFRGEARALDGVHDGGDGELGLEAEEDAPGEVNLRVDDALGGELADHFGGDEGEVVGGAEALGDGFEGHEEGLEIGVDVDLAGGFEGEGLGVVAARRARRGFRA